MYDLFFGIDRKWQPMKNRIGYCGLDCEKCGAYIATITNDQALGERTAALWAGYSNTSKTVKGYTKPFLVKSPSAIVFDMLYYSQVGHQAEQGRVPAVEPEADLWQFLCKGLVCTVYPHR